MEGSKGKGDEGREKERDLELIPLPSGKKVVGCKWVFTVKQMLDGTMERYKLGCLQRVLHKKMTLTTKKLLHPMLK